MDLRLNKRLSYKIIFVLDLVTITMIGLLRTVYMLDAFAFSMVPMLLCMLIILFSSETSLFNKKSFIVADGILTIVFIAMLSIRDVAKMLLKMNGEVFDIVFKIIYLPILFVSLMIVFDYAIKQSVQFGERNGNGNCKSNADMYHGKFLGLYYPTWLIIAVSYPFAVGYYPGNLDNDFNMEWVMGGHPIWSDWHTVGFAFFVRLCTLIIRNPFMVTIVQSVTYYLVANFAIGKLYKNFPDCKKMGYVFAILYMVFAASLLMSLNAITKDTTNAPLMFAFSVALFDYLYNENATRKDIAVLGVLGFLASIFRHAMIAVVVVTMLVVIVVKIIQLCKGNKEGAKKSITSLTIVTVSIVCAFVVFTEIFAFNIVGAERNPSYISYTIPMNLAGSMAYRSSVSNLPIDEDIVAKMEQIISMDKWAEYYCPFDADPLCRPWHKFGDNVEKLNDPKIQRDVISVDVYYLLHYPVQCIFSYLDITSLVWQISNSPELVMYTPAPAYDVYSTHHLRKGEFFSTSEEIRMFLGDFAIGRTIVYRGGLYIFIIFMVLAVMLVKRRFEEMIALLPVLLYAATLMLSIPQQLVRYVMAFQCNAVFFAIVAFAIDNNKHKKERM